MDGSNNLISRSSTNNPSLSTQHHYQQHLPSSSMPFSSYYLSSTRVVSDRRNGGGEEDLGSGAHGFTGIASPGIDPAGFFDARAKSVELDLDAHGSESEEGVGFSDGPAKRTPPRGGSGSKRSRAAEVHNLSEKRRRSRINEKMKALQNLIPNSNKTDKASMLDEAIEYLKQLQLQVQMLSMRNGLNLHPIYMPGVLQPLHSTQLNMGFAVDNESAMNMGLEMLPLNLASSARNSYGLSDQCTSSHPPLILPNVPSMPTTGTSFGMESSQSHHRSLQLPVAPEIFTQDMVSEEQLDPGRSTRNLQENEIKSMAVAASLHFGGQASSLEDTEHLEGGVLGRKRSEDMRSEDHQDNHIFIQHLNGIRTGSGFASGDIKPESCQNFDA